MDTTDKTIEDVRFDEAFQTLPSEVEDFMWSELYTKTIDSIKEVAGLDAEKAEVVRLLGYDVLIGEKTLEKAGKELLEKGFTQEQVVKVLVLINEGVLTKAQNINEYFTPEPEETISTENMPDSTPIQPPAPDVLSSLKERITVPTTIKPITTPVQQKPVEQQTKTTVDPYRELPQ